MIFLENYFVQFFNDDKTSPIRNHRSINSAFLIASIKLANLVNSQFGIVDF